MNKYLPLANDKKINQHNHSGLDRFDKFVSLAHFLVSKKRTTAHLRTPFHYFQLTSRALTVPLLLPSRLHGDRSPYYSFVNWAHDFADFPIGIVHPVYYRDQWIRLAGRESDRARVAKLRVTWGFLCKLHKLCILRKIRIQL